MDNNRLTMLLKHLEDEPSDPFDRYAVAIEYLAKDREKARAHFEQLLDEHPNYVPTYYQAAQLFQEFGLPDKAEATYKKGLEVAKSQQDHLAQRELQNAYNEFLFDSE